MPTIAAAPVNAGDFKNAQKIYVPPTQIERRIDFASLREHQAAVEHGVQSLPGASAPHTTPMGLLPPPPLPGKGAAPFKVSSIKSAVDKVTSSPEIKTAIANLKTKAANLAKSGKFDEAQEALNNALKMSPKDKDILKQAANVCVSKARNLMNNDDLDNAIKSARQALNLDKDNIDGEKLLNELLTSTGINPKDAAQRLKSADLLASQGKNDEAAVEYREALKLKPSSEGHIGLGNIALRNGHKDTAKTEYLHAIELEPNSSVAHRQLGLLRYGQNDVVGANSALSRAVILNPKDDIAGKHLVELWQRQVSKAPGANSHLGLARAYQLTGDLKSAQGEYKTVVRLDPNHPHLAAARQAFKLALARQEAEKALAAAHTLEQHGVLHSAYLKAHEAVQLGPGDVEARLYEGQLLEKLGQIGKAREAYLDILKIDPQNATAAGRLKLLSDLAPAPAAMMAPPSQVFAGTKFAPDLHAALPQSVPSPDGVQNISNFATQLRNHMLTQQSQIQGVEDAAQKVMKQIGAAPSEELHTAAIAAAPPASPAESAAIDAKLASAANALSSAASALSAIKGGPAVASTAATAAPVAATAAAASLAPVAVASATAAPAATAAKDAVTANIISPEDLPFIKSVPKLNAAYNHMVSLQQQNQKLLSQIKQMHTAMAKMKGPNGVAETPEIAPISTQTAAQTAIASAAPSVVTTAPSIMGPGDVTDIPLAPPIIRNGSGFQPLLPESIPQGMPQLRAMAPSVPSSMGGQSPLQASAVHLELDGAAPKLGHVELSVSLRNDSDVPFNVPSKMKAIIKYPNKKTAETKILFADEAVPAHGKIKGVIKVPFDKVDPSADLVVPNMLPEGYGPRDIHLTTTVSYR